MIRRYTEKAWGYQETMELFEERVEVEGRRRFGVRWKRSIPLAGLNPTPSRLWARHRPYSGLAVVTFVAMLAACALASFLDLQASGTVMLAILLLWIAAVLVLLFISRPIESAMFTTTGQIMAIAVTCRSKAGHEEFEAFVAAVSEQIRKSAA